VSSFLTAVKAFQFSVVNVTHKSSILVEVHHNMKLWTTSRSLSRNTSDCDEETQKMFPYSEISLSEYIEVAAVQCS